MEQKHSPNPWSSQLATNDPPAPVRAIYWLAGLLLLLLLSGCQPGQVAWPLPPLVATPDNSPPAQPTLDPTLAGTNRLLVAGTDGNIFTVSPNGAGRFDLTQDASDERMYTQPTWSSTGERIGWTRLERQADGFRSLIVTSNADGSDLRLAEAPFPPFYFYWSPDDSSLAYLSNWQGDQGQTLALRVVDMASGGITATTVALGQPFYFSWAPDSQRLVTHVDNARVTLLALDGSETVLSENAAHFAAPQWSSNGAQLLYGVGNDDIPQLILTDAAGGGTPHVVTYLTPGKGVSFSLNSEGDHLAYVETGAQVGLNTFGPLFVYDLPKDEVEQVATDPVVAFFWSPDGSMLLFITPEEVDNRLWLRLQVWRDGQVRKLARFVPTAMFVREYLPFSDQYMQSLRFWAPDSSAIVFAGQGEDGSSGIWVQLVDVESPAQVVAEGVFATWSPR